MITFLKEDEQHQHMKYLVKAAKVYVRRNRAEIKKAGKR